MGKRSNFTRIDKDFYPTPKEAVIPLLPHLPAQSFYYEPCCGTGSLIKSFDELQTELLCIGSSDIEKDAKTYQYFDKFESKPDFMITNPPWNRKELHPIIENLSNQIPTWLLFDSDWMHTKQSAELIKRCVMIVSVGRVKWFPDSKSTGKDNVCWYLFDNHQVNFTSFVGRTNDKN